MDCLRLVRSADGAQFNDPGGYEDHLHVVAGIEPGPFEPATHQPDLRFDHTFPSVSFFFDLQFAGCGCHK